MKGKTILLSVLVLLIMFLGLPVFATAQSSGGGSGGGGSGGGSSLGLRFAEPSDGANVGSPLRDVLVQVRTDVNAHCTFTGQACNGGDCKDINYRECVFCDLDSSYFTLHNSYWDNVEGWSYEVNTNCRDESGNSESGSVTFTSMGEVSDSTNPVITLESPINNVNHVPNTYLEFEVDELAHCEYTLASGNGAGHISLPGYLNNYKKLMSLTEGNTYTLTLECEDLSGNSASKTATFDVTSGSSSGGGGGGQGGGCFDTDGGKDLFEKGISAGVYDSCISKYEINERYCTEDNIGADYVGECPSGYICDDGACIESDDDDRDDDTTSTTTYFKNCNYIWDSSPYIGQSVKITASIKDNSGSVDSDSVDVNVLESVLGGSGGAYPMDGKTLDIQIIEPGSGDVAGAVEIKINSKGPSELGEMSLGLSGDRWGAGFPISNRNCVAGGSGGGESGGGSSCEKYHVCEDGSEIQYCEIIKQYDDDGNVVGAGCACKQNPEELCTSPSSGGGGGSGGGEPTEIPSSGGGGGSGGNNETPIICSGCVLGDKCVPVGYRTDDKYCTIDSEIVDQKGSEDSCNNNFECSTNLCIDSQCVSSGVWQKFLRWLSRLFG